MTAERIRDKIAASKRKGLWMGGNVPLGYDPDGRTLRINEGGRTTNGRIHKLIDLAFLAPDIIRDVLDGKQPLGFTSDWCVRHTLPGDWQDQRALIATL